MANILRYSCPIDGLVTPVTTLDEWSESLIDLPIGSETSLWFDDTFVCANGHHFAINFKVEIGRVV